MNNEVKATITFDVMRTFSNIFNTRIIQALRNGTWRIYVGDCLQYTKQLLLHNGWQQATECENLLYDIVLYALTPWLIKNDVMANIRWSEDKNYIVWS